MNLRAFLKLILSAALASVCLLVLGGCSSYGKREKPIYSISAQTAPPQAVYHKLMAVRPPVVYPNIDGPDTNAKLYLNNFHLDLNNVPVEQAVKAIAGAVSYRSYTASSFANEKVTITAIGTVDELLAKIADKVDATVTVDHEHQEVRFMRGNAEQNLYSGVADEHLKSRY
jgi:hypothetical protein